MPRMMKSAVAGPIAPLIYSTRTPPEAAFTTEPPRHSRT